MARTPPPPLYRCPYCSGGGFREVQPDLAAMYHAIAPGEVGSTLEVVRLTVGCTPTVAQNQLQRLMNVGAVTRYQGTDNRWHYTRNAGPEATQTQKRRSA